MKDEPFDPGLQPERTSLAWQRTSISLAVGSLVYARIEVQFLGVWAWSFALIGAAVGIFVGVRAHARYRYSHRSLKAGRVRLADGLLPAIVAAVVFGAAAIAIAVTLARLLD